MAKKSFAISAALKQGLEESFDAAMNYSGNLHVENIPLSRIELDPNNPRTMFITIEDLNGNIQDNDPLYAEKVNDKAQLESLSNSIKEQGIINPILVYKYIDNYRLVAGERRTLASILAGKDEISAKILDEKPTELKTRLLQWVENIERTDLSLSDRLDNLDMILNAHARLSGETKSDITITTISKLIGCTKPHAINLKAVLTADNEIRMLIKENKIKNLEKASVIASAGSEELRKRLISACLDGMSLKNLKVLASDVSAISIKHKSPSKLGRKPTIVKFNIAKNPSVIKLIIDSILNTKEASHLSSVFKHINYNDHASVAEAFNGLIKKLEELPQ